MKEELHVIGLFLHWILPWLSNDVRTSSAKLMLPMWEFACSWTVERQHSQWSIFNIKLKLIRGLDYQLNENFIISLIFYCLATVDSTKTWITWRWVGSDKKKGLGLNERSCNLSNLPMIARENPHTLNSTELALEYTWDVSELEGSWVSPSHRKNLSGTW